MNPTQDLIERLELKLEELNIKLLTEEEKENQLSAEMETLQRELADLIKKQYETKDELEKLKINIQDADPDDYEALLALERMLDDMDDIKRKDEARMTAILLRMKEIEKDSTPARVLQIEQTITNLEHEIDDKIKEYNQNDVNIHLEALHQELEQLMKNSEIMKVDPIYMTKLKSRIKELENNLEFENSKLVAQQNYVDPIIHETITGLEKELNYLQEQFQILKENWFEMDSTESIRFFKGDSPKIIAHRIEHELDLDINTDTRTASFSTESDALSLHDEFNVSDSESLTDIIVRQINLDSDDKDSWECELQLGRNYEQWTFMNLDPEGQAYRKGIRETWEISHYNGSKIIKENYKYIRAQLQSRQKCSLTFVAVESSGDSGSGDTLIMKNSNKNQIEEQLCRTSELFDDPSCMDAMEREYKMYEHELHQKKLMESQHLQQPSVDTDELEKLQGELDVLQNKMGDEHAAMKIERLDEFHDTIGNLDEKLFKKRVRMKAEQRKRRVYPNLEDSDEWDETGKSTDTQDNIDSVSGTVHISSKRISEWSSTTTSDQDSTNQ